MALNGLKPCQKPMIELVLQNVERLSALAAFMKKLHHK